jgi:NAD(P)-dependent dehydrogenase (short-subunit alcohol dehydrogenase family)
MADGLMPKFLEGEIAIVTGGARGIGAVTAVALAEAGARVIVTARRQSDAEAIAEQIEGGVALPCDVSDPIAIEWLVREVERRLSAPTILINNAGVIGPIGRLDTVDPLAFAANINATLTGAALMARAVLPGMLAKGRGTIVNLSSGAARHPLEGWTAYCAAKAGLAMVTQMLALEYAALGIRVFGFAPGVVDTGMQSEIRASGINPVSQLARSALADPALPAKVIALLCGPAGNSFAGKEIDIRDAELRAACGLPPIEG